jgi:hypothetical protein
MLKELIDCRPTTLQSFESGAAVNVPVFSRWFLTVWLKAVFDAGVISEMPALKTIRFTVKPAGIIELIVVESFGLVRGTALCRTLLVLSCQDASVGPRTLSYYLSQPR